MKYPSFTDGMEVTAKVRYRDHGTLSQVFNEGDQLRVEFQANVKGVAPGQSAVFYEGDDVIGGGVIFKSMKG
jgi:tRNA-specific 2-thiouridylase